MKKTFLALISIIILLPAISQRTTNNIASNIANFDVNQNAALNGTDAQRSWWQKILAGCAVAGADVLGAYGGCQAAAGAIGYVGLATGVQVLL